MNSIMGFTRDSQAGPLSRDHLTTRLDLHNINCMQTDNNDAKNVVFWVAEMEREDHSPILCFKVFGGGGSNHFSMESNDFLLGLKTEFRRKCLSNMPKKKNFS